MMSLYSVVVTVPITGCVLVDNSFASEAVRVIGDVYLALFALRSL